MSKYRPKPRSELKCSFCCAAFMPKSAKQMYANSVGRRVFCSVKCRKGNDALRVRLPEYDIWAAMIQRCTNKNHRQYHDYGGRGISVCDRWRSFENFYADVGPRPSPKHEIDRYPNNNGNYEPGNVRWATRFQQRRNMRTNHFVDFRGRRITITDLAQETGVQRSALYGRINGGMSVEDAISKPVRRRGPNKK